MHSPVRLACQLEAKESLWKYQATRKLDTNVGLYNTTLTSLKAAWPRTVRQHGPVQLASQAQTILSMQNHAESEHEHGFLQETVTNLNNALLGFSSLGLLASSIHFLYKKSKTAAYNSCSSSDNYNDKPDTKSLRRQLFFA